MLVLAVYDRNRGVGQYFGSLQSLLGDIQTSHRVGKLSRTESPLRRVLRHIADTFSFAFLLVKTRPAVVHLNPSLRVHSLLSSLSYLILSKVLRCKVLLFFHGWDRSMEALIERNKHRLTKFFALVDAFIVLSSDCRQALQRWGIQRPIFL